MPELSGLQTLRVLKTIKITKNIPVLVVSALSDTENLALAVRNGSSGFISKPFTRATIYDKLIEVFGKEKLLQIAKGDETGKAMENITMIQESTEQNIPPKPPSKEEKSPQISPEAARANREELLEHYQSDEKKTLDSIKKLTP
jgi:response regulator RpfG family c-di-GMP phosphodiesterase